MREFRAASTTVNPKVGDGLLTLPPPRGTPAPQPKIPPQLVWYNEEEAEHDATLGVLSEGLQIYLRSVLEKAIHCARQRHNVDGIRLWHQQCVAYVKKEETPLSLRLGCDVRRQFAQMTGNAAMTSKRMEQALERQSLACQERRITEDTIQHSTSMGDLSLKPPLLRGADQADYHGKRSFEIYGGKESIGEPPLGRVPKQAKVEVGDLAVAQHFMTGVGRHRASTVGTSFFF